MSYFQEDYAQRVYAGVLGKVIGVYLGRPFEGWTYERIAEQLGDINYYVHDQLGVPLLVTDDDISGTFTFPRVVGHVASGDNNQDIQEDRIRLTAAEVGKGWLNYLIENRTILWWGGMGNSTEHTAYLRLKQGVPAPQSGSAVLNGTVVSEQIGAQIFIDGWAMMSPADPDQAAYLAEQAARVSHDGEAVYGAVAWAVMEAQAFSEPDTDRLLDLATAYIPADSIIRRLIDDVRSWHAQNPDWRDNRALLQAHYGYDKYGGNCHMVPNHGLMVLSLLHSNDDFSQAMKIVNTSGWDTDCNSGNLGCLMGIKLGLDGIHKSSTGEDWREPIADRIYVPTADPTWGISDCAREALEIVNAAYQLRGQSAWHPKSGAEFHFTFPGSVQGFTLTGGQGQISHSTESGGLLRLTGDCDSQFGTPVFTPSKAIAKLFEKNNYALMASPRVYPGQEVVAELSCSAPCHLYIKYYGPDDEVAVRSGEPLEPGNHQIVRMLLPKDCHPVFEVGVQLDGSGGVDLHWLNFEGVPDIELTRPQGRGSMWRRAWVNGADEFLSYWEAHRVIQNQGRGLLIQGNRGWRDYCVQADVTPHLAQAAGVAVRVQGMRRYYALLLAARDDQRVLQLVKVLDGDDEVLAQIPMAWEFGVAYEMKLQAAGSELSGQVGDVVLSAEDDSLGCGSAGLVIEEGRSGTSSVKVGPAEALC